MPREKIPCCRAHQQQLEMGGERERQQRVLEKLRDAQDEALEKLAYRQVVRQQMPLRAPSLPPQPRGRSRLSAWAGVGGAIAVAASVALFISLRSHPAMSFEVGDSHDAGVIGAWIASPDRAKLPLHFSDGTAVSLDPGTRVRVADTSPEGLMSCSSEVAPRPTSSTASTPSGGSM